MKVVKTRKSKPAPAPPAPEQTKKPQPAPAQTNKQPAPERKPYPRFELDFLMKCTRETVIAELQRLAGSLGKTGVTKEDIERHSRMGYSTMLRLFGTLRRAHEAAGLVPARYTKPTDAELIRILADLWAITLREFGRSPKAKELKKYGFQSSVGTILTRFGSWKKALRAVAEAKDIPDAPDPLSIAIEVKPRPSISLRRRYLVMQRDQFQCRLCGRAGGELEIDHLIPFSKGGSNDMDNLQTLCKACNRGKANSLQPVRPAIPVPGEIQA